VAQPAVPDSIAGASLADLLRPRLTAAAALTAGAAGAASAAGAAATTASPPASVVWVDGGDEVLVHLDSLATQVVGSTALVSLDLETDQTGRTPLVVAFAMSADGTAGLVAATDQLPRGNGVLAARWGAVVREAAWSALLALANDHASERSLAPRGLAIANGQLQLKAGALPALQGQVKTLGTAAASAPPALPAAGVQPGNG
jgi:hypothetical protein